MFELHLEKLKKVICSRRNYVPISAQLKLIFAIKSVLRLLN